ncbi:unnamed protein product (macronuclear) [Paramecium tetraurelia]|uniref:Uncharacterized protein n=1 Tax=Paramecium tetraurelia TaxID=5888 RepID=A0DNY5_PARTE|nr:uncharacterized protein GSPATT00018948001 [Paramecium tetraurelia]CAK84752.1 unnamed protein product [Paramecium tetraurelia]|eukprot:XP_001452149.1 hypothetical protein (macronuclear) [Paramecium tetraurelia strain d4-2]
MNHESENTPLIQQEFPPQQSNVDLKQQPKVVSINQLLFQNTTQALNPAKMISKQIYVFSNSLKKSLAQYRNNESISLAKNITTSLEEFDGLSYDNSELNKDQSLTAKGAKFVGKTLSKIKDNITGSQKQPAPPSEVQQQNSNETIAQQSLKQEEENL